MKADNQKVNQLLDEQEVFQPILEFTLRESRRDNLLSSAAQEMFDFIRKVRADQPCARSHFTDEFTCRRTAKMSFVVSSTDTHCSFRNSLCSRQQVTGSRCSSGATK